MSPPSALLNSLNELNSTTQRCSNRAVGSSVCSSRADVGRAAVRLHPEQFLEARPLALGFEFRARSGRVPSVRARTTACPPRHREFAALGSVAHDRRLVVRKHAGHRRQVADVPVHHSNSAMMAASFVVIEYKLHRSSSVVPLSPHSAHPRANIHLGPWLAGRAVPAGTKAKPFARTVPAAFRE